MSTPNVFKHYQFQEKQAQLLHQIQNYDCLCCFPLSICHSTSRNHKERSAMVKIFQFSHQTIKQQDKIKQVYQISSQCSLLPLQCNVNLLLFT